MLVLVDDETGVCASIALEQLLHTVLDGFNAMLVVLDDHHDLRSDSAGEGCVGNEHDGRSVDNDEVVLVF